MMFSRIISRKLRRPLQLRRILDDTTVGQLLACCDGNEMWL